MTTTAARQSESYAATVRRLSSAQKGRAPGAPAYSIYVNRPIGRLLAAACYRADLSPNAVTAISAVFTFLSLIAVTLVEPQPWLGVLVAIGLALGYAFDSADGQVARLRGGGSLVGEWLDHVVDSAKVSFLHLAVLIAAFRFWEVEAAWLLVPIAFCLVAAVGFFTMILNDQLKAANRRQSGIAPAPRTSNRLRSLLLLPTDYGVLCLVFLLVGIPGLFLVVYTALFAAQAAHLALALVSWFRQLSALDTGNGARA